MVLNRRSLFAGLFGFLVGICNKAHRQKHWHWHLAKPSKKYCRFIDGKCDWASDDCMAHCRILQSSITDYREWKGWDGIWEHTIYEAPCGKSFTGNRQLMESDGTMVNAPSATASVILESFRDA